MENNLHARICSLELIVKDQAETIKMLLDIVGYGTERFARDYHDREHEEEVGPFNGDNLRNIVRKLADQK